MSELDVTAIVEPEPTPEDPWWEQFQVTPEVEQLALRFARTLAVCDAEQAIKQLGPAVSRERAPDALRPTPVWVAMVDALLPYGSDLLQLAVGEYCATWEQWVAPHRK